MYASRVIPLRAMPFAALLATGCSKPVASDVSLDPAVSSELSKFGVPGYPGASLDGAISDTTTNGVRTLDVDSRAATICRPSVNGSPRRAVRADHHHGQRRLR